MSPRVLDMASGARHGDEVPAKDDGRHTIARILGSVALAAGCTTGGMDAPPACEPPGAVLGCAGATELRCGAGGTVESNPCEGVCVEPDGCLVCEPSSIACADHLTLVACAADGSSATETSCGANERCVGSACVDPCGEARDRADYLGCEYYATPLPNPLLPASGYSFAVVIANGNAFDARVAVDGGRLAAPIEHVVPAQSTAVIALPWIDELSRLWPMGVAEPVERPRSAIVSSGAYRVVSDVPVAVTQWNPLEYASSDPACRDFSQPGCASQTNDASLLLPVHALGTSYRAASFITLANGAPDEAGYRGIAHNRATLAVLATEPGETVVRVTASGPLEGLEGEVRIETGETRTFTLAHGEVLSLAGAAPISDEECAPVGRRRQCAGDRLDPSGTAIESDRPVAAFSGHECAFVPFDRMACDHLEEQLVPVTALGRRYLLAPSYPFDEAPGVNLVRVISAVDDNTVRFDPPLHDEVILDDGEWLTIEQREPLRIEGSGRLLVAQYAVGGAFDASAPPSAGDPAMVLAAPEEQWQPSYLVQVPGSYTSAYATVIVPEGHALSVDGAPAADPGVAFGDHRVFHVTFDAAAAVHRLASDVPIGATVHGYAPWTSYMHLGGMRVASILE
jgi:hypothetical protein